MHSGALVSTTYKIPFVFPRSKINLFLSKLFPPILSTRGNVIEIEGLLFPGFGEHRRSMENWFFPSSDVTRALKIFQPKSSLFECPCDVT